MKAKWVEASELSLTKMVAGNEKKYKKVIDWTPVLKEWVGIGWIEVGEPSLNDYKKFPVVRRDLK